MPNINQITKDMLDKGYSINSIADYLSKLGYKKHEIEQALAEVQFLAISSAVVKHEHKLSLSSVIMIFVLVAIISYASFTLFQYTSTEGLLDLELEPSQFRVQANSDVNFNIRVMNLGSKDKFDIVLKYKVLDEIEKIVSSQTETVALSTSILRDKKVKAPSKAGRYSLVVDAFYDGRTATSSFTFIVEASEKENEQENESKDQNGKEKSFDSIVDEVKQLASAQPSKAEALCLELSDKDDCLSLIVKESRRPEFCNNIESDETRDNCYMSFIVEGQTYLCPRVKLESNVDYCNRISDIQILAKYYQE